jgi:hypothetical protein
LQRNTLGSTIDMRANGDNSGASAHVIDAADYDMWRAHFGGTSVRADATPEPVSLALVAIVAMLCCGARALRQP